MSKCVYRIDLKGRLVGEPLLCVEPVRMFDRPEMPTVEQCVQLLLVGDEIFLSFSNTRAIMQGPKVVGYIRIVEESEWAAEAKEPRESRGGC